MESFTDDRQRGEMDLNEAMTERHSVRMYTDEAVDPQILSTLASEIKACNAESGLHIQMAVGLDDAFCGCKTHYGHFTGVHNAIVLVAHIGKPYDLCPNKTEKTPKPCGTKPSAPTSTNLVPADEAAIEEKVGYYGEQLALRIVQLGLATSWAVLDDAEDGWWKLERGERLVWVLAFGHPARAGAKHHSKPLESLCSLPASLGANATLKDAPAWFQRGIEAASLAPTSLSQQPFVFELEDAQTGRAQHTDTKIDSHALANGNDSSNSAANAPNPLPTVSAHATPGLFAHVGLGCAKRNFEIGAGPATFQWAK